MARLQSLLQLEELSVSFSVPLPRPSAEGELLNKRGTPVTLRNPKHLTFVGVSAYLESLLAQIETPFLERLNITLFMQIDFAFPHLSCFLNITEKIKSHLLVVGFGHNVVSITTRSTPIDECFVLHVRCRQLDWQIECAAQVCSAIMHTPLLAGVELLGLEFDEKAMPEEWQDGEIDARTWHEFLRSFIRVKTLHVCCSLSEELSRAFEGDEIGSDPGFLPDLQAIVNGSNKSASLFLSFIHTRQVANRPVRQWWLPLLEH